MEKEKATAGQQVANEKQHKGIYNSLNNKELKPLPQLDWKKCLIDLSKPVPPPEPLLIQVDTDITMFTRRNISTIAAAAKVGKTFLISAIAAAALSEDSYLNLYCPETIKVLFIDTEMDESDTQEVTVRIHRILKLPTDMNFNRLFVLNLREQSEEERMEYIEKAIKELNPDIVLLDGVVDLGYNFNEIDESKKIVSKLTKLATANNCHICTVLHVNKNSQELRGHLGAFLRQKGELILLLTKKNEQVPYIECKPIDSRRKPIEDFAFRINSEGLPEIYQPVPKPPQTEKLKGLFSAIIPYPNVMIHKDLMEKVMEKTNVKDTMAKTKIKQAVEAGIIEKNNVGHYHLIPLKNEEDETYLFD